ncbi:hypothetical protein bcere0027_56350 [Bacillus cereus AH676]|nr:hypothetical protein bcere0027_56350 [Bacillus cereus AH676]
MEVIMITTYKPNKNYYNITEYPNKWKDSFEFTPLTKGHSL